MDTIVPVPKPRPSPLPRLTVPETSSKKPVPMPRQRLKDKVSDSTTGSSTVDHCRVKNEPFERDDNVINTITRSLKEELKLATDSVQEKGKFVIEGTRNASLRIRKNIAKRLTVRPPSPNREESIQVGLKIMRSQSLPSEDIFQSISFNSPFITDIESDETVKEGEEGTDDDENHIAGAPPPIYPPPPLPDESVYDELQSVLSFSSSYSTDSFHSCNVRDTRPISESVYEVVTLSGGESQCPLKPQILCNITDAQTSVYKTVADQIEERNSRPQTCLRSDSWSFYDTASGTDAFRSANNSDDVTDIDDTSSSSNINNKDSISYVSNRTISCSSISPSLLSELDELGYNSGDDMFDDERSSSSPGRSSTSQSVSIQNELYDNWEPKLACNYPAIPLRQKDAKKLSVPSKSVILEFDPLYENVPDSILPQSNKNSSDILLHDKNIKLGNKSPSSKINRVVKTVILEDFEDKSDSEEVVCPPVPPRRYDSITLPTLDDEMESSELEQPTPVPHKLSPRVQRSESVEVRAHKGTGNDVLLQQRAQSMATTEDNLSKQTRGLARWNSMKRALTSAWSPGAIRRGASRLTGREPRPGQPSSSSIFHEIAEDAVKVLERPVIAPQLSLTYSGMVYKVTSGRERQQDFAQRWCILAEDKLTYYADKSATSIRDVIPLSSILSIHVVLDHKISTDGDCFEISTAAKGRNFLFGTSGTSERRVWMQKILESLTSTFPMRIIADYTRAGWCFLKEGISGTWNAAWLLVHKRTLFYCLFNNGLQEVDLKKARCIVLQQCEKSQQALQTTERGTQILVDHPGQALYLRMDTARETAAWQKAIRAAAVDNGPNLAQQQLTHDDIPCIVDKCVNFVYAHGSMSEGIYRRSGANSSVTRLLEQFRLDAWSVQLSHQEYSEYDVSSVLKRFFRDLPEPLFTTELHGQLCDIAAGKCGKDRLTMYRRALEQLPPINFLTSRKLIGHLHFIHEQHEKNLMPVENLAAIWGPTLMHIEAADSESLEWSKLETATVADLITMHAKLFEVDAAELNREKRIQEVLERYHSSISGKPQTKPSGELHVWVFLHSRDSNSCVNITIGPQKLAGEVCADLCGRMSKPFHELCLQEVICGGALVRPMHHTEKVLDTVLRWGYWDDMDRKDNCLILTNNDIIKDVIPLAKPPLALSGDLKFADQKTKTFKNYLFEFSQAKLCLYNHKRCSIKLNEWKIEDIVWYIGHESKRNPQMRWTITFIEKNKKNNRSKESPYFGCAIAGITKEEQLKWMAALLIGEYPQGLLPSPVLLQ